MDNVWQLFNIPEVPHIIILIKKRYFKLQLKWSVHCNIQHIPYMVGEYTVYVEVLSNAFVQWWVIMCDTIQIGMQGQCKYWLMNIYIMCDSEILGITQTTPTPSFISPKCDM